MATVRNFRNWLWLALMVGGLYLYITARQRTAERAHPALYPQAQAVIDRTDSLYRSLYPQMGKLSFSLLPPLERGWEVECFDEQQRSVGFFRWDKTTGELFHSGALPWNEGEWSRPPKIVGRYDPIAIQECSLALAKQWLDRLSLTGGKRSWQLHCAEAQPRSADTRYVIGVASNRKALVGVNVKTGNLVSCLFSPRP